MKMIWSMLVDDGDFFHVKLAAVTGYRASIPPDVWEVIRENGSLWLNPLLSCYRTVGDLFRIVCSQNTTTLIFRGQNYGCNDRGFVELDVMSGQDGKLTSDKWVVFISWLVASGKGLQKLAYWVIPQFTSLGDFLLAPACPIEKVTLWVDKWVNLLCFCWSIYF